MCGIAGCLVTDSESPPPSIELLKRMAAALHHRGPDESGLYRDRHLGLAHARLAIIDVTTGQQPLSNEDGSRWIVMNGEIYNYVELRQELLTLGHRFRTRSDTEVALHAWEAWGEQAFNRFNGQWAIAVWDASSRTLVLSRDRLGVCPLYSCEHRGHFYFASEVKAIFAADPTVPRSLDPIGLAQTFTFWSVVPPRSIFAGIRELQAGHVQTVGDSRGTNRSYWVPDFPATPQAGFAGSLADAAGETARRLEEAVRLRILRADVPVGSYLSGGLDSSLIAALGRRVKGASFCTFSIRFKDAEYDETTYQRLMAAHIGSDHREVVVSRRDIAEALPAVVWHTERPILRTAPAPLFLLSQSVRQAGIKVVLTGEGADEVFAGYDIFREGKIRRFWARQPHSLRRPQLLARLYPYLSRSPVAHPALARQFFGRGLDRWRAPGFAHLPRWQAAQAIQRLFDAGLRAQLEGRDVIAEQLSELPPHFATWPPLAQDQYLEMKILLTGYILSSQGDRMLMAHSVEGRFPFLDCDVVALANALPASYKLRVLDEKHVLKRVGEDVLPLDILRRKKQPYRTPDALCFTGPGVPEWVEDVISERALASAGIFEPRGVRRLYGVCREGGVSQFSNADNMALVGVLTTQLLHRQFVASMREWSTSDRPPRTLIDRLETCAPLPTPPDANHGY
jgi:asparagine synthase (glutamine-hydrolysing)